MQSNIPRRLVSIRLSEQARIWNIHNTEGRERFESFPYRPIDIKWIHYALALERDARAELVELARESVIGEAWYEDLFCSTGDSGTAAALIGRLPALLGMAGDEPADAARTRPAGC